MIAIQAMIAIPDGPTLPVSGVIGCVQDLPENKSRISVGFGTRVISSTRDSFSNAEGSARYGGLGITGWLDLGEGWQPYLTTTKDGIASDAWDALTSYVFSRIEPLLKRKEHERCSLILDDLAENLADLLQGMDELEVTGPGPRSSKWHKREPNGIRREDGAGSEGEGIADAHP